MPGKRTDLLSGHADVRAFALIHAEKCNFTLSQTAPLLEGPGPATTPG